MRIIEFEAVDQAAIYKRGVGGGKSSGLGEDRARPLPCQLTRIDAVGTANRRGCGGQSYAEHIEDVQFGDLPHIFGQIGIREATQAIDDGAGKAHRTVRKARAADRAAIRPSATAVRSPLPEA